MGDGGWEMGDMPLGHNNFPRNLFERHNVIFHTGTRTRTRQDKSQGEFGGAGVASSELFKRHTCAPACHRGWGWQSPLK